MTEEFCLQLIGFRTNCGSYSKKVSIDYSEPNIFDMYASGKNLITFAKDVKYCDGLLTRGIFAKTEMGDCLRQARHIIELFEEMISQNNIKDVSFDITRTICNKYRPSFNYDEFYELASVIGLDKEWVHISFALIERRDLIPMEYCKYYPIVFGNVQNAIDTYFRSSDNSSNNSSDSEWE